MNPLLERRRLVFVIVLLVRTACLLGAQSVMLPQNTELASAGATLFLRRYAASEGLGPQFNAQSCASCHSTPVIGGSGRKSDSFVAWAYTTGSGVLGEPRQRFMLDDRGRTIAVAQKATARRRTPPLFGVGRLESVPTAQLQVRSDPFDEDGDGISGRLPWRDGCFGRFGWQSSVCDIHTFVVGALNNELGITSFPRSQREISPNDVGGLVSYVRSLPPPPSPISDDGADLFERTQCATCHVPVTGIATIAGRAQEVKAYTDLLLHEMRGAVRLGERDSRTEFRTPALWGVGATAPYLHDGSAPTLEQAIFRHSGEATEARRRFTTLASDDRQRLLHFVATR